MAFDKDGIDAANQAEREELEKIRQEKKDKDDRNFEAFAQLMKSGREIYKKEQEEKEKARLAAAGTDDAVIEVADDINPFSGMYAMYTPYQSNMQFNMLRGILE